LERFQSEIEHFYVDTADDDPVAIALIFEIASIIQRESSAAPSRDIDRMGRAPASK
jgi:hypothetical protein